MGLLVFAKAAVVNTGDEDAIVVTAEGIDGLRCKEIDGAGKGELRWENGPEDAAEDIGIG